MDARAFDRFSQPARRAHGERRALATALAALAAADDAALPERLSDTGLYGAGSTTRLDREVLGRWRYATYVWNARALSSAVCTRYSTACCNR